MPGQKSIYEMFLVVNHPLQGLVLLQDYLITETEQLEIVTNQLIYYSPLNVSTSIGHY
jgi:hypothetical protein